MNSCSNYKFIIFEITPIEQLEFENSQKELSRLLEKAFENIGYHCLKSGQGKYIFKIKNKEQVKNFATILDEDEYIWLVADFFENLLVIFSQYDILFALASSKNPKEKSPFDRPAWHVSTEIGYLVYPPSIPRILAASALIQAGYVEFGKRIDCTSSFPREIALSGDITFVESPIHSDEFRILSNLMKTQPVSILSSNLLVSQAILDLLRNESALNKLEIAKALPIQLTSTDVTDQNKMFSLFNHFTVKARIGSTNEVLKELLDVSLHLNWEFPKNISKYLPKEKALKYALMQKKRLKNIERKEESIRYALQLLQKKYPSRTELFEWEVNNIYSNIVRYSPVYLVWKSRLESYIQCEKDWTTSLTNLVGELDWKTLQKNGIVSIKDIQRIMQLLKIDPGATLTKIRTIIEKMILTIYKCFFPSKRGKNLANMLHELNEKKVFPPVIYVYFNTLRLTGNIGAHQQVHSKSDVEVILPLFIRVVEWFVDFINREHVI